MKTINRILISSVFFALISIVSILGIMSIFFFSLVPEYGKEMLDQDVFKAEEILRGFDTGDTEWSVLNADLNLYGYNLLVTNGDIIVFFDLEDSQIKAIESLKGLNLGEISSLFPRRCYWLCSRN
ncbi:hypothetical protein EDD66_10934 [Mobilisporobacter senegalensis]|uniref:Uncharacterized protein n=1 Tax=Mobilisporobacter senegalensis TaxID=1329262 RepID=A0A3N1XGQ1_9FIRM|nr:hypothetical protein [Mobilisporobacter senegalensis]ROR25825.1 hypothetical protein EDD66_10934 [Mobilisporobacter senegalensis]